MLRLLGIIPPRASKTLVHNLRVHFWESVAFDASYALVSRNVVLPALAVILLERAGAWKTWENRAGVSFQIIFAIGFGVFPLLAAYLAQGLKRKLPLTLWVTAFQRLPWYLGGAALLLWGQHHPLWVLWALYASWALYAAATGLAVPLWQHLIVVTVPTPLRGKLYGWVGFFARLIGGGSFLAFPWVIHRFPFPGGHALLFAGAALGTTISFFIFMRLKEPRAAAPAPALPLGAFLRSLPGLWRRDAALRALLTYKFLGAVASLGTQALVTVRALDALGQRGVGNATVIALLSVANSFALIVGFPLLGRLGDRVGWKTVEAAHLLFTALGFALAIPWPSAWAYGGSMALLGLGEAAIWLSSINFVIEFGGPKEKVLVSSLQYLVGFPALAMMMAGGFLADRIGSGQVLGVASALGFLVFLFFVLTVPEPRHGAAKPPPHGEA